MADKKESSFTIRNLDRYVGRGVIIFILAVLAYSCYDTVTEPEDVTPTYVLPVDVPSTPYVPTPTPSTITSSRNCKSDFETNVVLEYLKAKPQEELRFNQLTEVEKEVLFTLWCQIAEQTTNQSSEQS